MPDADYRSLRRRLRRSLRNGNSPEFAVRAELARAGEHARSVGMAMLIAALRMPDAFHDLKTTPSWVNVKRGLVRVNDVLFVVQCSEDQPSLSHRRPRRHRRLREWVLWAQESLPTSATCAGGREDLASFVGLSVLFRSGWVRADLSRWVAQVRQPDLGARP